MRPNHSSRAGAIAAHARDPRLDAKQADIGDTRRPPTWLHMYTPRRFECPIVRRRDGAFLAGKPIGSQLADRDPAQRWLDILGRELVNLHLIGPLLGIALRPKAALLSLATLRSAIAHHVKRCTGWCLVSLNRRHR